ncbi:MAG: D-cysteine desulfhydrase family protein, partial [Gammaproteobacteria bacterium]
GEDDVWVDDSALAPGYGMASKQVWRDIGMLARAGLLTDPVYSGKTFSCVFELLRRGRLGDFRNIAVIHTGGLPALFAYRAQIPEFGGV